MSKGSDGRKKVLIIGAGAQGNVISNVLARADDVKEIILGDIDVNRAREIASFDSRGKIVVERVDASDIDSMSALMKKYDVDLVINATLPRFVHSVMKASFAAGKDYIDMASNEIYPTPDAPTEQFLYAKEWKERGLICLTGAGGDPGLSNIMAKEGIEDLDTVESIQIKDFGVAECDRPVALWSMTTYLEDMYLEATIWENGKPKKVGMFSGEEVYDVPKPIGMRGKFYFHDHEESVTIPLFCGKEVGYCDFKIGEPGIDTWRFIVEGLDLMNPEPIDINGCRVSPRDILFKKLPRTATPKEQIELYESGRLKSQLMLICDIVGKRGGRWVKKKLWTNSPDGARACKMIPGTNDVSWITSVPCSVFSLMMLRGEIKHRGVFPPEVLDREEREIFLREIEKWDIRVLKQEEYQI